VCFEENMFLLCGTAAPVWTCICQNNITEVLLDFWFWLFWNQIKSNQAVKPGTLTFTFQFRIITVFNRAATTDYFIIDKFTNYFLDQLFCQKKSQNAEKYLLQPKTMSFKQSHSVDCHLHIWEASHFCFKRETIIWFQSNYQLIFCRLTDRLIK